MDKDVHELVERSPVTISRDVYEFLMGEGPLEGVWFGEMNEGYKGAFWWRALLRCSARLSAPPRKDIAE